MIQAKFGDEPTVCDTCRCSVLFNAAREKLESFCLSFMRIKGGEQANAPLRPRSTTMGLLSVNLLIALQIVPGFFCICLFLALYDSVILLKHVVLMLSRAKPARREWCRMLTSEGLRCVWNSFLLDAYKQAKLGQEAPNSNVVQLAIDQRAINNAGKCGILDLASSERPLIVNFGSAT